MVTSAATVGAAGLELPQPAASAATIAIAARPIVKRNLDIPDPPKKLIMKTVVSIKGKRCAEHGRAES
jgi:hypothetical protein